MHLLFLALLVTISLHFDGDYTHWQWQATVIAAAIPICLWLQKRTSGLFALSAFYVYCHMAHAVLPLFNQFTPGGDIYRLSASCASAVSFVCLSTMVLASLKTPEKHLRAILLVVPLYGLINSAYVIAGRIWGFGKFPMGVGWSGFLDYSGMNGVLIALCALPLLNYSLRGANRILLPVAWGLNIVAIVLSMSSIPYGVLAVGVAAYLVCGRVNKYVVLSLVGAVMLIGAWAEGSNLFDSAKRFTAYQVFMGTWWQSKFVWLGTGPGTFIAMAREIQLGTGFDVLKDGRMYAWKWMHSDILQTVFELGIIGGTMVGATLIQALYKLYARNEKAIFSIAAGLLAAAVFNYPCRSAPTALLIALCVGLAYLPAKKLEKAPQNNQC